MHHVDGEMHLIGVRFQTRRNGIHPRQQFREGVHQFLRRPFDRRVFDQKIDDFHSPKVGVEILFAFRFQELGQ